MSKYENLPFPRGEVHTDPSPFEHLIGREYEIEDVELSSSTGARDNRSGKMVRVRLVKNAHATAALLPMRVVKYSKTGGKYGSHVDFQVNVPAEDWAGVVDEFIPATGAPPGSVFYIVVGGPSKVLTPHASAEFNGDITVGDALVASTAAASVGSTDGGGRVAVANVSAASSITDYSAIQNAVRNQVGRALSAATTGQTATAILVEVGMW